MEDKGIWVEIVKATEDFRKSKMLRGSVTM